MSVYLGRIVAIARTERGPMAALYRVSSRSFPNRQAVRERDRAAASILPKEGSERDVLKNPYIAYRCARIIGEVAVLTNGSQTDPIAEKIAMGYSIRDAMISVLAALDYEKDAYDTPRIAAAIRRGDPVGWLGAIRKDGLDVRAFSLEPGRCLHLSTYEHAIPDRAWESAGFTIASAAEGCRYALSGGPFATFSHPVAAVCALESESGFDLAVLNGGEEG